MKRTSYSIALVTLVTLGSGIINILSVVGPSLPERYALLKRVFPLEFLHLSRFMTLLIGLALLVSALNIQRRKRRAWLMVSILAAASIVFHITKGLDYEEATASALLLGLLYVLRPRFTVASGTPQWGHAFARLAIAVGAAFGYGVAGFWLLDKREFGVDFHIGAALHQTVLVLSLIADPTVTPHTHYARWFIQSLYLMTYAAFAYSILALFRPVVYRLRTHAHERETARQIVALYGRSSSDYFKLWPDKTLYFSPSRRSFLAYRVGAGFAVVLGDPVGPVEEAAELIAGFGHYCRERDWAMAFHQATPDYLPLYSRAGFKYLKIGDEAIVDLTAFTLQGRKAKDLRYAISHLEKRGIRTERWEPPLTDEQIRALKEVSDEWLSLPGRRERQFTLGRFDAEYIRGTPVVAALDAGGRVLAFVNLIPTPVPGESTGDLMRRRDDVPNGTMDYLFAKLLLSEQQRGIKRYNFGLAPLSGFQDNEQPNRQERALHAMARQLGFLFSYKGLYSYKAKFATRWEPRYVVYRNLVDLARFAVALGRVSEIRHDDPLAPARRRVGVRRRLDRAIA